MDDCVSYYSTSNHHMAVMAVKGYNSGSDVFSGIPAVITVSDAF